MMNLLLCFLFASDDHGLYESIKLSQKQLETLQIQSFAVKQGQLEMSINLQAEVRFIPQNIVHVSPRASGIVKEVFVEQGGSVEKGQVLAVIKSRELGLAKSEFLAAKARQKLYESSYLREKQLFERNISPEQDFLAAQTQFEESKIQTLATYQSLLTYGVVDLEEMQNMEDSELTRYTFRAPISGRITQLHITTGEFMQNQVAMTLVDTSKVWVIGHVQEKDLAWLDLGQTVSMTFDAYPDLVLNGKIDQISSSLNPQTRTAEARVVVGNPLGKLKNEMFARLTVFREVPPSVKDSFLVPKAAICKIGDRNVVFRKHAAAFETLEVAILKSGKDFVEVKADFKAGDHVITGDLFVLKSEVQKEHLSENHTH